MDCELDRALGVSLKELFPKAKFCGCPDILVRRYATDPEECRTGTTYVCLDEDNFEDVDAIQQAVANGANAILADRLLPAPVPMCLVPDVRKAVGILAHALADYSPNRMHLVGVTGSHGKTTTTELLSSVMSQCEVSSGVANSLRTSTAEQTTSGTKSRTSADVSQWIEQTSRGGSRHGILEITSAMLAQHQLAGATLDAAILTNIRQEHAAEHGSVRAYRAIKRRIINYLKPEGFAVVNMDDPVSADLVDVIPNPTITYGIHQPAQVTATLVERFKSEQTFLIHAGESTWPVRTHIIGHQHIYRCLAVAAYAIVAGYPMDRVIAGLEAVSEIPGELQRIECGQPHGVFVHNASSPDRLASALKTLRTVANGKLIVLIGSHHRSSGEERAMLGRAAERNASKVFMTSDTHSSDKTETIRIIHDMLDGCSHPDRILVNPNRLNALQWALDGIDEDDCILVASHGGGFMDDAMLLKEYLYDQGRKAPKTLLPRLRVVSPN